MNHLLSLTDITPAQLAQLCAHAHQLKRHRAQAAHPNDNASPLAGRTLALLFEKPSLRTRVSFEVAMTELGGSSLYLSPQEVGLGKRESIADVARVLSAYVHAVVIRTFNHVIVEEFAAYASIPVINGLTDTHHPCQGLTDIFTIAEAIGDPKGKTLTYVGDGNNVAHSLLQAAVKAGMNVRIATPAGYEPAPAIIAAAQREARTTGAILSLYTDPRAAASGAQVLYTDVWTSMGQEAETARRNAIFAPYQLNSALLALAAPTSIVMHPLPAHRGAEITDDAIDGPQSRVFIQTENRLHMQKAILSALFSGSLTNTINTNAQATTAKDTAPLVLSA